MRTFAVTDVPRAVDPLPPVEARAALEGLAGGAVEAWSRSERPLARICKTRGVQYPDGRWASEEVAYHPFVAAVHAAFDQHRPLVLSPDAIWLMIAQGFAFHVTANAEALRDRIVSHQGRELIALRRDDFVLGSPDNDWPAAFTALSSEVRARTGDLHALVVSDFTTTTPASRAASEIALLATTQSYFAYQIHTMCGIPEVTLTGTGDDWRAIRARAEALRAYDCDAWIDALTPVLDQIVGAEAGEIDRDFWSSLYKNKNASGGPYVTGWINVLLPYVLDHQGKMVVNRALGAWREGMTTPFGGGPSPEFLPSGLSRVPFLWKYLGQEYRMALLGGFVGVAQDPKTLALTPEIGWGVQREGA